jgi:hypothetical protein
MHTKCCYPTEIPEPFPEKGYGMHMLHIGLIVFCAVVPFFVILVLDMVNAQFYYVQILLHCIKASHIYMMCELLIIFSIPFRKKCFLHDIMF